MKPAPFDHARPANLADAIALLHAQAGARVLAGGQSLGPMLNLRLAQPSLLVQINHLSELGGAAADAEYRDNRRKCHTRIHRGWAGAGHWRRRIGARGREHRLSCCSQSRHDWRQLVSRRSCGGLGHGVELHSMRPCCCKAQRDRAAIPVHDFIQGAFRTALLPGEMLRCGARSSAFR